MRMETSKHRLIGTVLGKSTDDPQIHLANGPVMRKAFRGRHHE